MTELKKCPICNGSSEKGRGDRGYRIIRCLDCARDLYEKYGLKELTEEQKTKNLEHNTGIEPRRIPTGGHDG